MKKLLAVLAVLSLVVSVSSDSDPRVSGDASNGYHNIVADVDEMTDAGPVGGSVPEDTVSNGLIYCAADIVEDDIFADAMPTGGYHNSPQTEPEDTVTEIGPIAGIIAMQVPEIKKPRETNLAQTEPRGTQEAPSVSTNFA